MSVRLLAWFGLGAAPLAWTAQLVVGSALEETRCTRVGARWAFDAGTAQIAVTAVCGAVALASAVAALYAWRELRRRGSDRRGVSLFVAGSGILVSVIFLPLILLGGVAASVLGTCVQS